MRKSKQQFFWGATFFVILSAGLAGCTKTGSSFTTSPVTYITVMNQAPYAPTADIFFNDTLASGSNGIAPGVYSSKYGPLKPGSYEVKFKKHSSDSLMDVLTRSNYDTLGFYTLILYNDANKAAHAMKINDDFSRITQANANYRFFNLSPDAPSVDLYMNDAKVQQGRTTADNAGNNSNNDFTSAVPAVYNLKVKTAAGDSVMLNNVNLLGGNVYTIFLSGVKNASANTLSINVLQASY